VAFEETKPVGRLLVALGSTADEGVKEDSLLKELRRLSEVLVSVAGVVALEEAPVAVPFKRARDVEMDVATEDLALDSEAVDLANEAEPCDSTLDVSAAD
jgi:hypothetical protein